MYEIIDSEFVTIKNNTSIIRVAIICDTSADIPEPSECWAVGSLCRVANNRETFVLNNAREWV